MEKQTAPATEQIKSVIKQFIDERLKPKMDKLKEGEEEKRQKLIEVHQPMNWISDAARRVRQIQQVTHATKFSHPDSKGSSLFGIVSTTAGDALLGSHSIPSLPTDVVGNAAALDVYKFLCLEVGGKTLLQLAQEEAPELLAAFGTDEEQSQEWATTFAALDQPKDAIASHKLARQIYWPLVDDGYHLLAPLFSSSLVHAQYQRIREDRFSDDARAAREARRENKPFAHGYREYPNLAIQKFGGTKPQNISQLNSERHGEAWLLASLPPTWKKSGLEPPRRVSSIFSRWMMGFRSVREPVKALRQFLHKAAHNNIHIRAKRAELTSRIIDEVLFLAATIQKLPAGWSADSNCQLKAEEQYWLDPGRALTDGDFARARQQSDWQAQISNAFGLWINGHLDTDKSPMSAPEHDHWKTALNKELGLLREELNHG